MTQTIYSQNQLENILERADEQRQIYVETFKNIFAIETKTYQSFNQKGNLKHQDQIKSNFLVYQSKIDEKIVTEYRNITKINNKMIAESEQRAENFFIELLKLNSAEQELRRIQFENARYNKDLAVSGLTLLQAPVLAEHIRPYFDFKIIGTENNRYLVEYQQNNPSPYVLINDDKSIETKLTMDFGVALPSSIQKTNFRVRGKLWIDEKTFQLWREERELTIQSVETETPVTVFMTSFEYEKTKLEILGPKHISLVSYLVKTKGKEIFSTKNVQIDFEYSDFATAEVKAKSSGILEPIVIERKMKNK